MNFDLRENKLQGIIPPLVSPLKDKDQLDLSGLDNLINHVLAGGVHGLFLLGTTGEGPSLSNKLKYELIEAANKITSGRVPILVGITDASFAESLRLAEHAAEHGADGVVLAPPYYFPAGQPELLEYLQHLAPRLPLPLFIYNMPAMTKIVVEVDTLKKAAEIDNVVGFKDSGGNMIKFHEYVHAMRDKPNFSLLMGPEELLAESVLFGGDGGVCGGANIRPELYVKIYEAARRQDIAALLPLHQELFALRQLYSKGRFASSFIKGVKCSLSLMGICSDFMAEPFHAFQSKEREEIKTLLKEIAP